MSIVYRSVKGSKLTSDEVDGNFWYLESRIGGQGNTIVTENGFTLLDQELTIAADWVWRIMNVTYTNAAPVVINIPFASSGNQRIDLIVANQSNTFERIAGVESASNPSAPAVPLNKIFVTFLTVTDGVIDEPETPIVGNRFVEKTDFNPYNSNVTGTDAIIPLDPNGYSEIRLTNTGLISIAGYDLSLILGNANAKSPYPGKPFIILNITGHDVVIKKELPTADYPFYFSEESDLVFPNNHYIYASFDPSGFRIIFKSWVDLSTKLDKSATPSSVYGTDASGGQTMIPVSEFICTTDGKSYESLSVAMAVVPLPENNTIFYIDDSNLTERGVYAYDSNEVSGYRFVRDYTPNGVVEEGNIKAVSGGEVFNFSNKELSYVNLSYNKDTEGVIVFNSKSEARASTPNGVRKRGLVITYNLNVVGWITEQYVGSSANWSETDSAFVDISVSRLLNGQLTTYGGIEYNEVTKVLKFNSGVLAVSDGRRINTAFKELTMINGFSRIILRSNSIVSVPIDERLDVNPKNSNLLPTDINIGVVSVSNIGIEVFNGSGFNILSNRTLLLNNQRLSFINNETAHINFDLTNRKLIITGGSAIDVVTNGRYNLPNVTLDMLNTMPYAKVIYEIKTNTIKIVNQAGIPENDTLILFTYVYTGVKSTFAVNGIQNYLINGVNETFVSKNEEIAYLSIQNRGNIDFQTTRRKIVFTNAFIIDNYGTRITIPNMEVDMPTGMILGVVYYDKINNIIKVRNQTGLSKPNSLMLFNYHYAGIPGELLVQGLNNYSLNGVPNNRLDYRYTELRAMDNFAVPFFNVIQQNGVGATDDFDLYNITSNVLYNMYDNTIGGKSGVTKTLIGATEDISPINIYKYNIKFRDVRMPNRVKPKIAIVGGTHAGERLGLYSTYLFFNQLINNPEKNIMVDVLRNNFDWVFIPCNNPYSIDVGQVNGVSSVRWNHNGVDINRNYDWNWEQFPYSTIGSQYYKGTAPFSEKESQIVRDCLISELQNLVLVVDTHNFGGTLTSDYVDVWYSNSRMNIHNICSALSDRIAFEFRTKYDLAEDKIIAYSDYGLSLPTVAAWVNNVLNINALTLETSQSSVYKEGGYMYDGDVVTRSLTAYINSIYSIAKECLAFENDRIIGLP